MVLTAILKLITMALSLACRVVTGDWFLALSVTSPNLGGPLPSWEAHAG
jgi:hypothetical protein